MPLIRMEYDNKIVSDNDACAVSEAVCRIVSEETKIKDVFVYANSAHIKFQVAPIEIFVEMSASKIKDVDTLFGQFKERIVGWKKDSGFVHPINLTLIPMHWKFDVNL